MRESNFPSLILLSLTNFEFFLQFFLWWNLGHKWWKINIWTINCQKITNYKVLGPKSENCVRKYHLSKIKVAFFTHFFVSPSWKFALFCTRATHSYKKVQIFTLEPQKNSCKKVLLLFFSRNSLSYTHSLFAYRK